MSALVDWLLQSATPSIRYLTLRHLLDRPDDDPETAAARRTIMTDGPVPAILAKQTAEGNWGEKHYYGPKYVSTHWNMLLMVELAADPHDDRLRRGAEFMLAETAAVALAYHQPGKQDMGCLWGNILRYAVYFGYENDPRLDHFIDVLVLASQDREWKCWQNHQFACSWGAIRALWALAALPDDRRSPAVKAAIESGVNFVFGESYSLRDGEYPSKGGPNRVWSSVNFPTYYQSDVLFALRVARDLSALNLPQVQSALEWLIEKRQPDGRWKGTHPYRSQSWKVFGGAEEISRWASLHAATVLKQAGISGT
jgi:hypothetical protein